MFPVQMQPGGYLIDAVEYPAAAATLFGVEFGGQSRKIDAGGRFSGDKFHPALVSVLKLHVLPLAQKDKRSRRRVVNRERMTFAALTGGKPVDGTRCQAFGKLNRHKVQIPVLLDSNDSVSYQFLALG